MELNEILQFKALFSKTIKEVIGYGPQKIFVDCIDDTTLELRIVEALTNEELAYLEEKSLDEERIQLARKLIYEENISRLMSQKLIDSQMNPIKILSIRSLKVVKTLIEIELHIKI